MNAPTTGAVTYEDMVFGEVTTPNSAQQDAVLMRSDGVPLYNLGAVVDDITMGITIVARGRDHMINTPIQILLYEAFGAKVPQFAHLPMMLGKDGTKLSKRHGAVAVSEYRERGIPPHALLNYLARFGWSYGDEEVFALDDLTQKFDWNRCGRGDGKFDEDKLAAITFEHLKRNELISEDAYVDGLMPFLAARGLVGIDKSAVRAALPLYRERGQTWKIAADAMDYLFRDPPVFDEKATKKFLVKDKAPLLRAVAELVKDAAVFEAKALEAGLATMLETRSLQLKDVAQPARVALTGRTASPGLFEVVVLLGRDRAVNRLLTAADMAEKAE
jgi:glutamyl-tRNA synthetase